VACRRRWWSGRWTSSARRSCRTSPTRWLRPDVDATTLGPLGAVRGSPLTRGERLVDGDRPLAGHGIEQALRQPRRGQLEAELGAELERRAQVLDAVPGENLGHRPPLVVTRAGKPDAPGDERHVRIHIAVAGLDGFDKLLEVDAGRLREPCALPG